MVRTGAFQALNIGFDSHIRPQCHLCMVSELALFKDIIPFWTYLLIFSGWKISKAQMMHQLFHLVRPPKVLQNEQQEKRKEAKEKRIYIIYNIHFFS